MIWFRSPKIQAFIAFSISAIILSLLLYRIDTQRVLSILIESDLRLVALAVAISLSVNLGLGALKWRKALLYLGHDLSYKKIFVIRTGCIPFKVIFPLKSNEVVKALCLQRSEGIPAPRAMSSVILGKSLNLIVTISIFLTGLILAGSPISRFIPAAILAILLLFMLSSRFRHVFLLLPRRVGGKIALFFNQLISPFEEIGVKGKTLLAFYAAVYQSSEFLNAYILFRAVGIDVPISQILIFVPLMMVVDNLPVTSLGIGTREALAVLFFSQYGRWASALSVGILLSLVEYLLPAIVGLFFIRLFTGYFADPKKSYKEAAV